MKGRTPPNNVASSSMTAYLTHRFQCKLLLANTQCAMRQEAKQAAHLQFAAAKQATLTYAATPLKDLSWLCSVRAASHQAREGEGKAGAL